MSNYDVFFPNDRSRIYFCSTSNSSLVDNQYTNDSMTHTDSYSKIFVVESMSTKLKFFHSELICVYLTKHFSTVLGVQCDIPLTTLYDLTSEVSVRLSGSRENVKRAYRELNSLFATVKTKIFNDEQSDQKGKS